MAFGRLLATFFKITVLEVVPPQYIKNTFLPPANEVCEGYVFTLVCHSVHRGACMAGGQAWLGAMHGGGGCVAGEHVWQGGACMAWGHVWWGCMAGGMHGGGHAWQGGVCGREACMAGGHAWQ